MPSLKLFNNKSTTTSSSTSSRRRNSRMMMFGSKKKKNQTTKNVDFSDHVIVSSIPNNNNTKCCSPITSKKADDLFTSSSSPSCSTLTTTALSTTEFVLDNNNNNNDEASTSLWSNASSLSSSPSGTDALANAAAAAAASSTPVDDDDDDKCTTLLRDHLQHCTIPPKPEPSRWEEIDFLKVCHVWQLTDSEIQQMRILESKLDDIDHWKNNPFEVVRFLKGPQGYKACEKLFRSMIQWRIDQNVDAILEDYTPPQVLLDYCPSAILHGLDKEGDPIYLERAGATDASGLLRRFGHSALIKHVVWLRELCGRGAWVQDHEARMGRPITQATIVYDLAGLNSRHMRPGVLPFFIHMMQLTEKYYCGPVKKIIIIRAPAIFRVVWNIVKHVFDQSAVSKMVFTGAHNYEEILAKYMDLEVLPKEVCPTHGKGKAAVGMPQRFAGGIPPAYDDAEEYTKKDLKDVSSSTAATILTRSDTTMTEDMSTTFDSEVDEVEVVQAVKVVTSLLASGSFHLDDFGSLEIDSQQ